MADQISKPKLNRRQFLRYGGMTAAGVLVAACTQPAATPAPAAPTSAAAAAPTVIKNPSVAKNDFEAMYEQAAAPFRGKDITLRVPFGGEGFPILWDKKISPRFTELTGIKTQFESANYEQIYEKTFLDLGAKSGTYDLFDLNYTWFGQFMAANGLAPLEPWLSDAKMPKVDITGYIPALLETYGKWEGKLYGLPLIADAMIFPYNKVHFKDAGLDPEKPPKTWDEVYTYGKQLMKGERAGLRVDGRPADPGDVHLCRDLLRPGVQAVLPRRRHVGVREPRGRAGDGTHLREAAADCAGRGHDLGHPPGIGSGRTGKVLDGNPVAGHPGRAWSIPRRRLRAR